jgi:SUKH-3 immunity protein
MVTPSVMPLALAAGWSPARTVALSSAPPPDHPATQILKQFVGLVIRPTSRAGVECATTSISFAHLPGDNEIASWEQALDCKLIHIAETDEGSSTLLIGSCGRCFGISGIHPAFYMVGESFAQATENLLLGRRSRPMLGPSQEFVMLYGVRFERGNPQIWSHTHGN